MSRETVHLHGLEHTAAFLRLEETQQTLTRTLLDAIRDDNDNFDAVLEKHAIDIQTIVQQEHERTRAENILEAQKTRNTVIEEHRDTRKEINGEHTITRDTAHQLAARTTWIVSSNIRQASNLQSSTIQKQLHQTQDEIYTELDSSATDTVKALMNEIEIQHFITESNIRENENLAASSMAQQLRHSQMQIEH